MGGVIGRASIAGVVADMYWSKEVEIKQALHLFQEMAGDNLFRGVTGADLFAYRSVGGGRPLCVNNRFL